MGSRRRISGLALTLVLVLAGIGGGVAVARSLPARVYMRTFDQTRLFYRPAGFRISGDSTLFARRVHWRSWGGRTAVASATAAFNTCTPDCAAGRFVAYPARIVLSRRTRCTRLRRTVYLRIALTVTGSRRPRGYDSTQVLTAPCIGEPTLK